MGVDRQKIYAYYLPNKFGFATNPARKKDSCEENRLSAGDANKKQE
jgi:hypothetical protein